MTDDLPTDLWIAAHIRQAVKEGVPMIVVHKGDASRGSIFLKINRLDGTAQIMSQLRMEDELVWCPMGGFLPESEADSYLAEQTAFDPDVWIVEIEDRQGRLWFPGRIVNEEI